MISAVVISIDDNLHIEKCIEQLHFVDQIIIIGTLQNELCTKVLSQSNITYIHNNSDTPERLLELGEQSCTTDWVLGVSGNTLISEELKNKLLFEVQNNTKKYILLVRKKLNFMGKKIKFSGYQNLWEPLLWPNDKTQSYPQKKIAEDCTLSYKTFDAFNKRLTEIAKRQSSELYHRKKRPNWFNFFWKPFWTLKQNFVLKLGFLDGKEGFILAYIKAFAVLKTQLFLWLKYRTID